jgi:hypothetical protein
MESKDINKKEEPKGAKNTPKAKIKQKEVAEVVDKGTKLKTKPTEEVVPSIEVSVPLKAKKPKRDAKKKESDAIKPRSKKTVFQMKEGDYNYTRDYLHNRGDEYELVVSGTTEKIRCGGRTYLSFDRKSVINNGYFISNAVKKDVSNWLADENNTLIERKRDYVEQKFALENIEKNIGKILLSIDINDCYWQTAYNMGFITKKTYEKGLEKKAWKVGRNASIGSLCKTEMVTTYKNGMIVRGEDKRLKRRVIHRDERYQHVRHNIIGYVHDMFMELTKQLGEDFFMFLTDCVFTTIEKKQFVEDFFRDCGYKCKYKTFEFMGIDKEDRVISWVELKEVNKPKYYKYAEQQILIKRQTT